MSAAAALHYESDLEEIVSDAGWDTSGRSRLPDPPESRHQGPCRPRGALLAVGWLSSLAVAGFAGHEAASWRRSDGAGTRASVSLGTIISKEELPDPTGFYQLFENSIREAKHIDLTHAFSPTVPVWPGFGPSSFAAGVAGASISGFVEEGDEYSYGTHGFQTTRYTLTTDQLGTQLDPPAHWNEYGATISDLPSTFALRPLVVIDIHEQVAEDAGYHATLQDVKDWESANGRIPEASAVFFRSDWYKGWDKYADEGLPSKYPGVTLDALKFLHLERGILLHGHEPLDTDMTPTLEGEAWLMHNNFAQAEGLANLDLVPAAGCLLSIGFAKPLGGLGGYARYVAICPPSSEHGETIGDAPGAPLPKAAYPLRRDGKGVMRPTEGAEPTEYCAAGTAALGCDEGEAVWA